MALSFRSLASLKFVKHRYVRTGTNRLVLSLAWKGNSRCHGASEGPDFRIRHDVISDLHTAHETGSVLAIVIREEKPRGANRELTVGSLLGS